MFDAVRRRGLQWQECRHVVSPVIAGSAIATTSYGGVTASTGVWVRGMRAEGSSFLVNPLENQCNCGTAACTRRLIDGDASLLNVRVRG